MNDLNNTQEESFGKIILENLIDKTQDADLTYIEPLNPNKNQKFSKRIKRVDLSTFGRLRENIKMQCFIQKHCDCYGFYQKFSSLLLLIQIFFLGNIYFSFNYFFMEPRFYKL